MEREIITSAPEFDPETQLGVMNITLAVYSQELFNLQAATIEDLLIVQGNVQQKVLDILTGKAKLVKGVPLKVVH